MRTKLFFILPLLLGADIALADSFTVPGSLNLTIGTTGVSGTAGLLYGDGAMLRSLPGTVTIGSNYESLAFGNNVQLSLTTDGTSANYAATLALINTSTTGGWGNSLEVYSNLGGYLALSTYINNTGIYYSTLNMVISGHYSLGSNPGGHSGGGYSILSPNNYYPNMYACWADITGSCYQARNNAGTPGELSFSGQTHTGVFTIGLDAENSQFILGNTTITTSGQVFTGDTFIARAAAANIRFGGADAAAPVAQTISFQNVLAGTSNTAGVNTTFKASAGTGTGAGGSFLFQTALPGSSGTTQNAFATVLTIDGASGVTVASTLNAGGSIIGKTRTVSTATDTISATGDYFLCVAYTSTGAVTETLPAGVAGQTFLIKDCGGGAATHPITIAPASGTIDGASSYSLATNYGSVAVTYANSQWSVN
jgi:hypothetical protein